MSYVAIFGNENILREGTFNVIYFPTVCCVVYSVYCQMTESLLTISSSYIHFCLVVNKLESLD